MQCENEYATGLLCRQAILLQSFLNTTAYQHHARAGNLTRQETKFSVAVW